MESTDESKPAALLKAGDSDPVERSEAARLLGKVSTDRKAEAARENGKLGGKPKNATDSEETRRLKSDKAKAAWALRKQKAGNL